MPSFDAVSKVDLQEMDNAVNQVLKEIAHRYDFKGSKSTIEFDRKTGSLTISADDSMKLRAMSEMLKEKVVKRGIGVRVLDFKEPEEAAGGALRQKIDLKQGISTDDARKMVKMVKDLGLKKVQAQIQQDQVRVNGPKKDDLQAVIKLFREQMNLELQFVNFKD